MRAVHGARYRRHALVAALHVLLVLRVELLVRPSAHAVVAVVDLVLDVGLVRVVVLVLVLIVGAVPPLVVGPAPGVHEEVADGGWL